MLDPVTFDDLPPPEPVEGEELTPFALEVLTSSGQRLGCTFISSFAGEVGNLRRNYYCSAIDGTDDEPGDLFGEPDRSRDPWRIHFAPPESTTLTQVPVAVAWI